MFRHVVRHIATTARLKQVSTVLQRTDPRHVLNTSFVDTINDIASEQKRYTVTNYETRIRVNHYLQAVFQGDTAHALQLLGKFKDKCKSNRTHSSFPRNVQIYISCLSTLAAQLSSSSGGSDRDFTAIRRTIDEVASIPEYISLDVDESQLTRIWLQLVIALVRHLDHLPSDDLARRHRIRKLALNLVNEQCISTESLEKLIETDYPQLLRSLNYIWPFTQHKSTEETKINVLPFLNKDGSMSYLGLCDFIGSSRYQYKSDQRPMFEIYDSLEGSDKDEFFKAYLDYNKARQLEVEHYCGSLQESFSSDQNGQNFRTFNSLHGEQMIQWHHQICSALQSLDKSSHKSLSKFEFFFTVYPVEKLVSLVLTRMISLTLATGQVRTITLARSISSSFKWSFFTEPTLRPMLQDLDHYLNDEDAIEFFCGLIKVVVDTCVLKNDDEIRGTKLFSGEKTSRPVFSISYQRFSPDSSPLHRSGIILLDQEIMLYFQSQKEIFHSDSYLLPMLCPPVNWTSPMKGGFLESCAPLVRSPDEKTTFKFMEKANETGQLSSLYRSLSLLGSVPWTINRGMLDVFNHALEQSRGFLSIPPPLSELMVEKVPTPTQNAPGNQDDPKQAMRIFKRLKEQAIQTYNDLRGLRITYELINKLANSYGKNGDIMYLPHNVDFRGRAYPAVSFLSHHNEDLVRSVLMFWEARELGPNGYDWLKYQLANLYSKTSLTMPESIHFVASNMENIIESAQNPFGGSMWWTKGDKPWQCLALCKELLLIESFDGPPSTYKSRIPVHQDGTCNGLQHYAALGADEEAAKSVNLLPSAQRQDVYLAVLELVKKRVHEDSASEDDDLKHLALISKPLLSRKLIKQTVMTTVYGVTLFGASRQIEARVQDVTKHLDNDTFESYSRMQVASYIAKTVLKTITELFSGAKAIQDWLVRNCIRCITSFRSEDLNFQNDVDFFGLKYYRPMMWSSLSGFPVVQPYRHFKKKEIVTPLQKVMIHKKSSLTHINVRKQLNALAPNFIHSLDAIHLQMTCLEANRGGINFAAVHDSFWTHAGDVEILSRAIRLEFVRLHSSHIIQNLKDDLDFTNRDAMQVVWAENQEDPLFIEALQTTRQAYNIDEPKQRGARYFNKCLMHELKDPSQVSALVREHSPKLWFQPKNNSKTAERYDQDIEGVEKVSPKTHTPLLVAVKILPEPPIGKFDVEAVLGSKYFFS